MVQTGSVTAIKLNQSLGCWQLFIFLIPRHYLHTVQYSTVPHQAHTYINWGNRSKSFEMYRHLFLYEHRQRVISSWIYIVH